LGYLITVRTSMGVLDDHFFSTRIPRMIPKNGGVEACQPQSLKFVTKFPNLLKFRNVCCILTL
jgi:hypothetical protein